MAKIFLRSIDTRSVTAFQKEVKSYPRITNEEACKLAELTQQGDEQAHDSLFKSSLWSVVNLALWYKNQVPSADIADMINEGSIGLEAAIFKFDPTQNFKFQYFADRSIKQSIMSYLTANTRLVRMPGNAYKIMKSAARVEESYVQKYGYAPSTEEVAEQIGVKSKSLRAMRPVMVDSYDTKDYVFGEDFAADDQWDAEELEDNKYKVRVLLSILPKREQFIMTKLYGLDGSEPWDQDVVADAIGLTSERVRQLKVKSLTTMRKYAA